MECMSLLGFGVCAAGTGLGELPFEVGGIDREAIPVSLRRRTSQATQLAFSAAVRACRHAGRLPAELLAVFASVGGEMQVTDQLCIELAKADGVISPTAFHNSVHNTAAGYWSIVHGCRHAVSAMAAGRDTFALGLLESWCQLHCGGGELLLVCYDECWPDYLAPPMGDTAFAASMVLAAGRAPGALAYLGQPVGTAPAFTPKTLAGLIEHIPAAAALPMLQAVAASFTGDVALALSGWRCQLTAKVQAG